MNQTRRFVLNAGDYGRALVLSNLRRFLDCLPDTKTWRVEISLVRKTRTPKQRRALFGVAYAAVMEQMGLRGSRDKENLHEFFCGEYWGWTKDGLGRPIPVRTTTRNAAGDDDEIDTERANDFYRFIQQRCAENGIEVPDPDPLHGEQP